MKVKYFIVLITLLGAWSSLQAQTKKNEEMVTILPFKAKTKLKIGQKATYSAMEHGSVGHQISVSVLNDGILKSLGSEFVYESEKNKNLSGGDEGTKTYTFEALKAGTTTIEVRKYFRGDLKSTDKITIVVANK